MLLVKCNKLLTGLESAKRNNKLWYSENVFLLNVTLCVRNITLNLHQNMYIRVWRKYEMPKSCLKSRTLRCTLIFSSSSKSLIFFDHFDANAMSRKGGTPDLSLDKGRVQKPQARKLSVGGVPPPAPGASTDEIFPKS